MQVAGELSGLGCRVTGVSVQQEGYSPAAVMLMNQLQEVLKILLPLIPTNKKQPLSSSKIHRPKDDTTSVPAGDIDAGWFAASAPIRSQRRKQKQVGLVLDQNDTVRRQLPNCLANSPFFSRAPGRATTCIAAASRRNRVASRRGGWCGGKTTCPCKSSSDLAAIEPSSSQQSNRVPRESGARTPATIRCIPRSKYKDVLNGPRRANTLRPVKHGTFQSNGKHSVDLHARYERSP